MLITTLPAVPGYTARPDTLLTAEGTAKSSKTAVEFALDALRSRATATQGIDAVVAVQLSLTAVPGRSSVSRDYGAAGFVASVMGTGASRDKA